MAASLQSAPEVPLQVFEYRQNRSCHQALCRASLFWPYEESSVEEAVSDVGAPLRKGILKSFTSLWNDIKPNIIGSQCCRGVIIHCHRRGGIIGCRLGQSTAGGKRSR